MRTVEMASLCLSSDKQKVTGKDRLRYSCLPCSAGARMNWSQDNRSHCCNVGWSNCRQIANWAAAVCIARHRKRPSYIDKDLSISNNEDRTLRNGTTGRLSLLFFADGTPSHRHNPGDDSEFNGESELHFLSERSRNFQRLRL